jgi:hypothetical protein
VPQVPAVADLDRAGQCAADRLAVGARAITAHDLHAGMGARPGLDDAGGAAGQDIDTAAVAKVKFVNGGPVVPAAGDGPVPALMAGELTLARSGALDTDLLSQQPFYGTNFTKPLLFIEDGAYFADQAQAMGLTGSQWGVMNETGSYPGQPWLWLYQLWYQVPGWTNSANIDMIAIYMTGLATILLLFVPFIPGLRDIPG